MPKRDTPAGPGVRKIRAPPLVRRRRVELVAACAGQVRALLEAADVVSEGGARDEGEARVYYGSTSLLLALPDPAEATDDPAGAARALELETLALALVSDPHVRLRALRVARREACARAGGPLGPLQAELTFAVAQRGARAVLAVTVDVTAIVQRGGVTSARGGA